MSIKPTLNSIAEAIINFGKKPMIDSYMLMTPQERESAKLYNKEFRNLFYRRVNK